MHKCYVTQNNSVSSYKAATLVDVIFKKTQFQITPVKNDNHHVIIIHMSGLCGTGFAKIYHLYIHTRNKNISLSLIITLDAFGWPITQSHEGGKSEILIVSFVCGW